MQPEPELQFYKPGDSVPASGIYAVCHTKGHRGPQEVVLMVNGVFPQCEICEDAAQYRLVRAAPYVSDDPDFKDGAQQPRVLVVDDESLILSTLNAILEHHGFDVDTAASAREGIQKLSEGVFEVVITDMRMESLTAGYDVVRAAQMQPYQPATLLLTAIAPQEAEWRACGIRALFEKPVNVPALVEELRAIIEHQDSRSSQAVQGIAMD